MLPSTFTRKLLFLVLVIELGIASAWVSGWLAPDGRYGALIATICDLIVAFGIWATAPTTAKLFVPRWCCDPGYIGRCAAVADELRCDLPIHVIPSDTFYAGTLGITEASSHVYITTGLLDRISQATLRFVIAHEQAHAREQHILTLFLFVTTASAINFIVGTWLCMVLALLYFLAFRRYLEFRADAAASNSLSKEACTAALLELDLLVPALALQRRVPILFTYPTVERRIRAIQTRAISVF